MSVKLLANGPETLSVRETSKAAYRAIEESGQAGSQRRRIYEFLVSRYRIGIRVTRRKIARALDMETSTVAARVKALIDSEFIEVMSATSEDPITHAKGELLRPKNLEPEQQRLIA